jgi:hypothetical protein
MSFVSVLKKVGMVFADVASVYAIGEPLFRNVLSTPGLVTPQGVPAATVDKLDLIFKSIFAVEGQFAAAFPVGKQTGPQKLLAASALIGPILSTVDTIRGKPIANQAALTQAIQSIAGGFADYLNAIHADNNQSTTAASVVIAPATTVTLSQANQPPAAK